MRGIGKKYLVLPWSILKYVFQQNCKVTHKIKVNNHQEAGKKIMWDNKWLLYEKKLAGDRSPDSKHLKAFA